MVDPKDRDHQAIITLHEPYWRGTFDASIANSTPVLDRWIKIAFAEEPMRHSKLTSVLLQVLINAGHVRELHPNLEFLWEVKPTHFRLHCQFMTCNAQCIWISQGLNQAGVHKSNSERFGRLGCSESCQTISIFHMETCLLLKHEYHKHLNTVPTDT